MSDRMTRRTFLRDTAVLGAAAVWVNGVPTPHLIHDRHTNGYIGLEIHALPATATSTIE